MSVQKRYTTNRPPIVPTITFSIAHSLPHPYAYAAATTKNPTIKNP